MYKFLFARMYARGLTDLRDMGTVEWVDSVVFLGPSHPLRTRHVRLEVVDAEF